MSEKPMKRMLADRVLIKPSAAENKTNSGIIIPDTAQEKPQRGVIIQCGPGKVGEPISVFEGEEVLYAKHAGTKITHDGVDYLIMREADLWSVL